MISLTKLVVKYEIFMIQSQLLPLVFNDVLQPLSRFDCFKFKIRDFKKRPPEIWCMKLVHKAKKCEPLYDSQH
jgi:hypothetical protein